MPCMVPRQWISPPEGDNEDGELVNEDEEDTDEDCEEGVAMLAHGSRTTKNYRAGNSDTDDSGVSCTSDQSQKPAESRKATTRSSKDRDGSGWPIPESERAPLPKVMKVPLEC